jgi:ATP-dependent Clp protease ATP-binding subunit ClpX
LRSILESLLLDTMYELPEQTGLRQVVVDADAVNGTRPPRRVFADVSKTA